MLDLLRDKGKNRTERIVIRCTLEEKKIIKEYCKQKNIDVSKYIYNLVVVDMTMFHKERTEEK